MMTRSSNRLRREEDSKKQVTDFNIDVDNHADVDSHKVDNISCHGLCLGSTKCSNYSSASSARNRLKLAMIKEKQLARQLELEEQLKRQENAIRLQKIKDEVEVAQLMVEAEEEEERQGISDVPVTSKLDTLTKFLADCKLSVGKAEPIPQTDDEKLCGVGNHVEERHLVHREFRPMGVVSQNPGPPHAEHSAYVRNDAEPPRTHSYQFELPKAELTPFFGDVTDYRRFIKQFEFYV